MDLIINKLIHRLDQLKDSPDWERLKHQSWALRERDRVTRNSYQWILEELNSYQWILEELKYAGVTNLEPTGLHCPKCGAELPPVLSSNLMDSDWIPAGLLIDGPVGKGRGPARVAMVHYTCGTTAIAVPVTQAPVADTDIPAPPSLSLRRMAW